MKLVSNPSQIFSHNVPSQIWKKTDKQTSLGSKVPWIIHKLIEYIAEYIQGDKTFAEIFGQSFFPPSTYSPGLGLINSGIREEINS